MRRVLPAILAAVTVGVGVAFAPAWGQAAVGGAAAPVAPQSAGPSPTLERPPEAGPEPPLELLTASYFGTAANDGFEGTAAGPDGCLYLVGNAGTAIRELPGGAAPVSFGVATPGPRCGCGFVMKLSPDGSKVLAYAQFGQGILHATAVAVTAKDVYVGGYASAGLEPLLKERRGLMVEYPLREALAAERAQAAGAEERPRGKPDPIAGRPWLGRLGAPCVLRFSCDLRTLESGTYLEGWQQVYEKFRNCGRGRPMFREHFWQPTDICPLASGDVVVAHDGGYMRALTDKDREAAARLDDPNDRAKLLDRLAFYDVADHVSRLSGDLTRRAWTTAIYTPPVVPDVTAQFKKGWALPHYGNPRIHRMRADRQENLWVCGWSASATSNEPWWSPFLWRLDPQTGRPTRKLYEYDPMSGGGNRMGGTVADTALVSVAIEEDGNLLACLIADGGNTVMERGPRGHEGGRMARRAAGPGLNRSPAHFWGQVHRIDGKTFDGLGGARTGPYAWTVDAAGLPDGHFLALGRWNAPLPWTPNAWWTDGAGPNPNAFLRVVGPDDNTVFWTAIPGMRPFELAPIGGDRFILVGFAADGTAPMKASLVPQAPGGEDAYFAVVKWRKPRPAAWQYRVPLEPDRPGSKGGACAYLWLPPASETLRGLLVGGEAEYAVSPAVRQACAENDLGIVLFRGYLGLFRFWLEGDRDAEKLLRGLDLLADRTGHPELRRVPWITFGHSTGGIFCRNVAYWKPDRVAAVIHYKSGNFHQRDHLPPEDRRLAGVPVLVINGQYETFGPDGVEQPDERDKRLDKRYGRETQWVYVRSDIQKFRRRDPNHLMSLLLDLGGDHFFGSPELWEHAALFIRKTARYRIPARLPPGDEPVRCLPLKAEDGWLTDPDLKHPTHPPAPYADYTGDKAAAFWHYDRQAAEAAVAHHRNLANPQCLTNPVAAWLDEGDGWTFRARAEWLDVLPETYGGPLAGLKVGHSAAPFVYRCRAVEPVEQTGPDTFRLRRPTRTVHIAAVHPGDATYRATNRWGNISSPPVKGEKQTIEFSPIGDLKPGTAGAGLKARASSGLPVYFEVDYGPVVIENGTLVVRDLPRRPQYPLECGVTAWQIGRRGPGAPGVEAAPPVSQTFHVVAP